MRLARRAIVVLGIVTPVIVLSAQAPSPMPKGTGLVIGQVVDGVTGRALPTAAVFPVLASKDVPGGRTLAGAATDSDGHFVLRNLPAGSITIGARKNGYIDGWYGAADAEGAARPLTLSPDARTGGLVIRLWPKATIGGRVVDDRGEPVADVSVMALKRTLIAGRWRLGEYYAFLHQSRTDDRGEYRITDLTPGEYVISVPSTLTAVPADVIANVDRLRDADASSAAYQAASATVSSIGGPFSAANARAFTVGGMIVNTSNAALVRNTGDAMPFAFPTVFFPGVTDASAAQVITIAAGQERLGFEFALRPVRAVSISGTVYTPDGPSAGIPMRLLRVSHNSLQEQLETATTISGANGVFTFIGITEGDYTIHVLDLPRPAPTTRRVGASMVIERGGSATDAPTLWGTATVAVGQTDVTGVALTLQTGARIGGTVTVDGAEPRAAARPVTIDIEPADGRRMAARVQPPSIRSTDGTFLSPQLPAGRYLIRAGALSTMSLNGRDVTEIPIALGSQDLTGVSITYRSTAATSLSGTARPRTGTDTAHVTVFLFPADRALWVDNGNTSRRMLKSGVSQTGAYAFVGLPTGDYLAAATDAEPTFEWRDPVYLDLLARTAIAVSVATDTPKTQDLTAVALPRQPSARRDDSPTLIDGDTEVVSGPFVPDDIEQAPPARAPQTPVRDNPPAAEPAPGTGAFTGRVIAAMDAGAAGTTTAVSNAAVVLSCADPKYADSTLTDANGTFTFRRIPVTRCTVSVSKTGYLGTRYGATAPGKPGTAIMVTGSMPAISIPLQRGSTISGTLRTDRGEPIPGVTVVVMSYEMSSGERTLNMAARATIPSDAHGNFRVWGLPPGEYILGANRPTIGLYATIAATTPGDYQTALREVAAGTSANPAATPAPAAPNDVGYTTTFYPGTPILQNATTVSLGRGEDKTGVDFAFALQSLATITVHATGPDGQPPAGVLARLFREENLQFLDFGALSGLPFPQPGATATLRGIPPGRYTLDVGGTMEVPKMPTGGFSASISSGSSGLPMFGQVPIVVDGRDIDINVPLSPAITVGGQIVFESTGIAATTPPLAGIRAALMGPKHGGVELRTLFLPADADGQIIYENLVPAAYRVQTTAPRGWMIKSATINGVDASDLPVDITGAGANVVVTYTDRVTEISGTLQSASGVPAPGYTVIIFSPDTKYWRAGTRRIVTARPATDGRFVATGLPPGEYRIAAVTDVTPGEWLNPAFLAELVPASVVVTIGDGEKKVQNLQIR